MVRELCPEITGTDPRNRLDRAWQDNHPCRHDRYDQNQKSCDFVAIEGPIEYLHRHKNSNVNQIREGKEHQIRSILGSGSDEFISLAINLAKLYRKGLITQEKAVHYCQDQKTFKDMLNR